METTKGEAGHRRRRGMATKFDPKKKEGTLEKKNDDAPADTSASWNPANAAF
ncbi:MAG: hypothetical protein KDM91_01750 [Verrucomicrobiae bacterium]|nr:hypothetical protein [Verrucomicrobiae bacterium]MCP5541537.1 hypothetical protein [Akkermansiaceae bacterium]